jgi:hypothetical protein
MKESRALFSMFIAYGCNQGLSWNCVISMLQSKTTFSIASCLMQLPFSISLQQETQLSLGHGPSEVNFVISLGMLG